MEFGNRQSHAPSSRLLLKCNLKTLLWITHSIAPSNLKHIVITRSNKFAGPEDAFWLMPMPSLSWTKSAVPVSNVTSLLLASTSLDWQTEDNSVSLSRCRRRNALEDIVLCCYAMPETTKLLFLTFLSALLKMKHVCRRRIFNVNNFSFNF